MLALFLYGLTRGRYSRSISDMSEQTPSIHDVKAYWERHPLLSHEVGDLGPVERWLALDQVKNTDVEQFALSYWDFQNQVGKDVLDIGCGPGWLTVKYATVGAHVHAVDLTAAAIKMARSALEINGLSASLQLGSAESLPFRDNSFDLVVSSGVLHHTPNPSMGFAEAFRVARPDATGLITLYRLGILHRQFVFPLVRLVMRLAGARHPGADLAKTASSLEDFVRQYDGEDNPIGIAKTERDWERHLTSAGWTVVSCERHYFPSRMVPLLTRAPGWLRKMLDRYLATMVYFRLRRVQEGQCL